MKFAHHIKITAFVKAEDKIEEIKEGLINLVGLDFEKEKLEIEEESASGLTGSNIQILTVFLKKTRNTNDFVRGLAKRLSDSDRKKILSEKESRLDEDVWFYIRIDKEKLVKKGKVAILDKGACIHIKLKLAAFPKKRETALKLVDEIFQ